MVSNLNDSDKHFTYFTNAKINYHLGEYKLGLEQINSAINSINNIPDFESEKNYVEYLQIRASFFQILKNTKLALQDLEKCIYSKSITPNLKARSYAVMADIYFSMGNKAQSLQLANKIREEPFANDISKLYIAKSYLIASRIFSEEAQLKKRLEYERLALYIYKEEKSLLGITSTQSNISHTLKLLGKYQEALDILAEAEQENKTLKNKYISATIQLNKAENYAGLKDFTNALPLFNSSRKAFSKLEIHEGVSESYLEESKLHFNQKNTTKAIELAKASIEVSKKENLTDLEQQAYLHLHNIYKKTKDLNNALVYYEKYSNLKYNTVKKDKIESDKNLKIQFEIDNSKDNKTLKETKLKLTKAEDKNATLTIALIVLSCLSVIIIFYLIFKKKRN